MAPQPQTAKVLLARNVDDLRRKKKLTRTQLAAGIGKSQSQISQLLAGKRGISVEALDDLAQFFEVPVDALFRDPSTPASSLTGQETEVVEALRGADKKTRKLVLNALDLHEHVPLSAIQDSAISDLQRTVTDLKQTVSLQAQLISLGAGRQTAEQQAASAPKLGSRSRKSPVRKRSGRRS